MDFQEKMHERGLVIILVIPNSTVATQDMDQPCSNFKQECDVSTQRISGMKIAACVQARKKALIKNT